MKKKIYFRNFAALLGLWLVLMAAFSWFMLDSAQGELKTRAQDWQAEYSGSLISYISETDRNEGLSDRFKEQMKKNAPVFQSWRYSGSIDESGALSCSIAVYDEALKRITPPCKGALGFYEADGVNCNAICDLEAWLSEEDYAEISARMTGDASARAENEVWALFAEIFYVKDAVMIPKKLNLAKFDTDRNTYLTEKAFEIDLTGEDLTDYESYGMSASGSLLMNKNPGTDADTEAVVSDVSLLESHVEKANPQSDGYMPFYYEKNEWKTGFFSGMITWTENYAATLGKGSEAAYWHVVAIKYNAFALCGTTLLMVLFATLAVFLLCAFIISRQSCAVLDEREELERRRRDMTDAIAHDLKTPLAAISGYAENLRENVHTEKRERYAAAIGDNALRMDGIIRSMLELSGVESASLTLRPESVNLGELTAQALTAFEPEFEKKGIAVSVTGGGTVTADRELLRRVLENLIANAAAYTPEKEAAEIVISGGEWSITNTGVQLDEKTLDNIWTAYYRADASRAGQGTGLGLAIVAAACRRMGFTASAENLTDGLRFWIEF